MGHLFRTTTASQFLRRYSLLLLVLLIPLSLLAYIGFGYLSVLALDSIVRKNLFISGPQAQNDALNGTANGEILLVSAFFPLSKSKHSMRQYSDWLSHFLQSITTDIYFYTTPELEKTIREIRGALPVTIDTRFSTAFDIPPLSGLENAYERMRSQDREREHHSPELYAIWAAKAFFLAEAIRMLPENKYTYAFWTDAGSFRSRHGYAVWPDLRRVKEVWGGGRQLSGTETEDLIFFPIQNPPGASMALWDENSGPIDNDFSEGSFFGGQPKTISWWEKYYYAYHDEYLARHIFVGKDQTLMNSLFLLHPERVITVWYKDPEAPATHTRPSTSSSDKSSFMLGNCGDPWYYYQFFLASEEERTATRRLWDSEWHYDVWNIEWWTRTRESCRATRVLAMEGVLRRVFGDAWTPPQATIQF